MVNSFNQEAEKKILGLIITEPKYFSRVNGILSVEDFSIKHHQYIFKEIISLIDKKIEVDEVYLLDYLENYKIKKREDWELILRELKIQSGIPAKIDIYIKSIKTKTKLRKLKNILSDSMDELNKEHSPFEDVIGKISGDILEVSKDRELSDFKNIANLTSEYNIKLSDIRKHGYQDGIPSGWKSLDNLIGGFREGELIIVAARPSMGKTAFALELSKAIAKKNTVGIFSIEMPQEQLLQRMVSSEAMITFDEVRKIGNLSQSQESQIDYAVESVGRLNLWIDDSSQGFVEELTWKARKLHELLDGGIDMIVVDYLQLLTSKNKRDNRQQQVSDISRMLKQLARELNVPVVALSQLSRSVESRTSKRPMMSDIRESGAIEQDADTILMLYRETYYEKEKHIGSIEELEIIVAKNRNGPTGSCRLNMNMKVGKIKDKGYIK